MKVLTWKIVGTCYSLERTEMESAVRVSEGWSQTLFLLRCMLFPAVSPCPSFVLGPHRLSRTFTHPWPFPTLPPETFKHRPVSPPPLHSGLAYRIVITHLLMNHLMFISLISLEAILGIRTLWLSMSSNVFAHSRCQKLFIKRMNDFSESRMS